MLKIVHLEVPKILNEVEDGTKCVDRVDHVQFILKLTQHEHY